jgi:competence protein ComEA
MQNQQWFKSFLSFTKSEVRGLVVLLILILILLVVRFFIHRDIGNFSLVYTEVELPVEEGTENEVNTNTSDQQWESDWDTKEYDRPAPIDPNSAGYIRLIKSGIPTSAAKQIIAYRNHGGRFSAPNDLLRFNGIDSIILKNLEGLLEFNPDRFPRKDYSSTKKLRDDYIIDLNRSDSSELIGLPGIGPVLSARIVKYRNALGGFYSPLQLDEVYGITDSLFQTFSKNLVADTLLIKKINLNTVTGEELQKHPYLNHYQAKAILSYRRLVGPFTRVEELSENYLIPDENYRKLRPYLVVN